MKTNPVDKMLKNHLPLCKMHEWSLMEKRFCSCGRDEALRTWDGVKVFLKRLDDYLENHDSVASNSLAHADLDELMERLK
jgi:hypothetical protein